MKDNSWEDCLNSASSTKVSPNPSKAKSLVQTAKGRLNFLKSVATNEENINYKFERYYTSVLEFMHAILIKAGYNVRNHICLGYYFRDVLKKQEIYRRYDNMRFKRNSLTYYGKKMDYQTAKDSIKDAKRLIDLLTKFL